MPLHAIGKTVLLVEDDQPTREVFRLALKRSGNTVVAVEDGVAALRYIESARPDVIVLDMGLPRLSGRDVLRELRANPMTLNIPIIIVTGNDISDSPERAGLLVLQKPVDVDALSSAVGACLRRALR